MTLKTTLAALLKPLTAALLLLAASDLSAQSMTVISTGGDAVACSYAAKLTLSLRVSRSDLDSCNRALEQAMLPRSDRAATYVNRGIVLTSLGRYQDALNDYNDALAISPELPNAYNGKGNLYFLAEKYDEALAAFNTALELKLPEQHAAFYNLGLTYEKLSDPQAAERSYRAALDFMPDWELAQNKLDRLLEQEGRRAPGNG